MNTVPKEPTTKGKNIKTGKYELSVVELYSKLLKVKLLSVTIFLLSAAENACDLQVISVIIEWLETLLNFIMQTLAITIRRSTMIRLGRMLSLTCKIASNKI